MPNDSGTRVRRTLPRFSLLTLLLVTTIVVLGLGVWKQWRELMPQPVEVRELRDEVGRLSIEDESKLHAIQVRTGDDLTWKWRVRVPEGMRVETHYRWGDVPPTGVPEDQGMNTLGPGEHSLVMQARRDPVRGNWEANLSTGGGSVGTSISDDAHWFD